MGKKNMFMLTGAALSICLMSGCGSSSTTTTTQVDATGYNGIFVDSATQGISWSCGTNSGVTNAEGAFGLCSAGTDTTFKLGNIVLGTTSVTSNFIFTPRDLTADKNVANAIASLLLSFDADANPDNGITITDTVIAAFEASLPASTNIADLTPSALSQAVAATIVAAATTDPLLVQVSPADAALHLDVTAELIANGTIGSPAQTNPPVKVPTGGAS